MDLYNISRGESEQYKVWIVAVGLALALAWKWVPSRLGRVLLLVLTLVATLNYARFGPRVFFERIDTYDFIHYYLNAKYFDELGYFDLYPASILADRENFGPYFPGEGKIYMAQDATRGHFLAPIEHAVERGRVVKAEKFTPERWAAFTHDFLYLQRMIPGLDDKLWRQLINDHGYNGTPVWMLLAKPFTLVPVEYVKWLGWIDMVLMGLALVAVGRTYGWVTSAWTTFWLLVTYSTRWPTFSWAFFRYDYVAALMLGMCAIAAGRPVLAGLATAWAATLRLFPAMWLYGLGMQGLFALFRRVVLKRHLMVLGAFLVGVLALEGGAIAAFGADAAKVHFENMEDHNESANLSSRRIGLALAIPFRGEVLPKALPQATKELIEEQKPIRFALAGAILLVLGWGLRRAKDDEAYAYGFLPFFLLTTASYYYYVARVTLVVLHVSRLPQPKHVFGLAWLLGLELFCNWAETRYPEHRVFLIGYLAWGLAAYAVVMALWTVVETRKPVEGVGDAEGVGTGQLPGGGAGRVQPAGA